MDFCCQLYRLISLFRHSERHRIEYTEIGRYTQQLTRGSLIIEIGCNGNTLTEALAAADRFADCAAAVLKAAPE